MPSSDPGKCLCSCRDFSTSNLSAQALVLFSGYHEDLEWLACRACLHQAAHRQQTNQYSRFDSISLHHSATFRASRGRRPIHKNVLNDYLLKQRCALLFSQISQQVTEPVRIIVSLCGLCLPLWVESRPVCRQSLHCHSAVPQIRRQNIRRCISRSANLNAYPDPTSAHAIAIRIKNCPFAVETGTSNTAASAGDCS
jgi:hypothetical protein